ncbi:PhzF family phenazine biosynthesis isomerase [Aquibacillus halophilus]|uniref:PhzF family phenazine biosynthesis isomerase n=1 Tax=Aquibacillus halophilus TaxID=930132 RepID=A0A6A8DD66_9BACI|nr:PhzF family phenazine biosynthesis protein [Aquibacillus halophilus]MRH43524.1 PhzF family phenazine biosynthesis isomerase [Aquibacillus halophilus]
MDSNFYFINAFTKEKFKGNPAAIVMLTEKVSEKWMQSLASEFNQPITTFMSKIDDNSFGLRWFTPTTEINLCGHGTLGAAHILWSEGMVSSQLPINFHTKAGELQANLIQQQIQLTFTIIESQNIQQTEELETIVGLPIKASAWAKDRYIIELENADMVHRVNPNLERMKNLDGAGMVITSRGFDKYDFVSRYFAPKIGVNEDHVTGSAHCALASYWGRICKKDVFFAYQDSARGGELKLKIIDGEKVELIGDCISLMNGKLNS